MDWARSGAGGGACIAEAKEAPSGAGGCLYVFSSFEVHRSCTKQYVSLAAQTDIVKSSTADPILSLTNVSATRRIPTRRGRSAGGTCWVQLGMRMSGFRGPGLGFSRLLGCHMPSQHVGGTSTLPWNYCISGNNISGKSLLSQGSDSFLAVYTHSQHVRFFLELRAPNSMTN